MIFAKNFAKAILSKIWEQAFPKCPGKSIRFNHRRLIHLVCTQNYPNFSFFLSPDTHSFACVFGGTKCQFFGEFAYVLNR